MRRTTVAALALALGLVVGGIVGSVLAGPPQQHSPAIVPPPNGTTPTSVTMGGPACLNESADRPRGWMHVVADGDSEAFTLNATVAHDPDRRVNVSVTKRVNEYVVRLDMTDGPIGPRNRTLPAPDVADRDCTVGSRIDGAARLQPDYDRLTVLGNGREIASFERDVTTARLHHLPNPVDLTNQTGS